MLNKFVSVFENKALKRMLADPSRVTVFVYVKLTCMAILLTFLMALVHVPAKPAMLIVIGVSLIMLAVFVIAFRKCRYEIRWHKPSLSTLLMAGLMISQIVPAILTSSKQTNALYRLSYATSVYDNGRMIAKAPYMSMLGAMASLTGIHPAVLANVLMAIVIIGMSYLSYRTLALTVSNGNKGLVNLIMIFVWLLHTYGYQSDKAMPMTLLMGYYTIESLVLHVILPLVSAYIIQMARVKAEQADNAENITTENSIDNIVSDDDYQEEWDMKKHKIINARNLAIALGLLALMLMAFVYILNNKINTLYDATVNMQSEINSSCKIYEFAPDTGIEGYIIKNSDGSLTVIGGGDASNADALTDAIKVYGDTVDIWYLYGEDDKDTGAYKGCISSGIKVKQVFVVERTDI